MYYIIETIKSATPETSTIIVSSGYNTFVEASTACAEKVKQTGNTNYSVSYRQPGSRLKTGTFNDKI